MRRIIGLTLLAIATTGCITDRRATLDPFMRLQNVAGPFVSQSFAERLARLVIEEKYQKNNFSIQGPGSVTDKGDTWWVTFDNAVQGTVQAMIPKRLTVHIRKTNGEIVTIT
jgi:hypothetical protein